MTKDKIQINSLKLIGTSYFIIPAPETKEMRIKKKTPKG